MPTQTTENPFITAPELRELIESHKVDVKIFDCTYHITNRDAQAEFTEHHIPNAHFFDIDAIADTNHDLPHMLPTASYFETVMANFGVNQKTLCVFYDVHGLFSAARGWWMCRVFGHDTVKILAGGLKAWQDHGFPTESETKTQQPQQSKGNFKANFRPHLVCDAQNILSAIDNCEGTIIDARSAERYAGTVPESRENLRCGHYPSSCNVPFGDLLTTDNVLKPSEDLVNILQNAGINPQQNPIMIGCGSGVTACIVALALYTLGNKNASVYDGSWMEWGSQHDLPIVTP